MKHVKKAVANKLQNVVEFQTELRLQENKYTSLLKADEPFEKLKEVHLKIKYLRSRIDG